MSDAYPCITKLMTELSVRIDYTQESSDSWVVSLYAGHVIARHPRKRRVFLIGTGESKEVALRNLNSVCKG